MKNNDLLPVDKPLGRQKRKFSETFDGLKMVAEHFNLKINNQKKTED